MSVRIKLELNKTNNEKAVIKGGLFADGVTNNSNFTEQQIIDQGVKVRVSSGKLKTALEKPKGPTRTDAVKVARAVWDNDVNVLARMEEISVNSLDCSDDEKAEKIHSANMEVVGYTFPKKHTFTAERGANSGEVDFDAEGSDAVAHLYTWTTDLVNYTNKADPWDSSGAKTTAIKVPLGRLAFFHKGIFRKQRRMDWEGPILLTVL
ncbi:MAG: hypothetical protein WCH34_08140 [Bacteroidota bacterium]